MILVAVLVGLVGFLIIPTLFSSPNFRTALMLPPSNALPSAPFTVLRSASNTAAASDLERLFRDLQKRNPGQVGEVTTVKLLADLSAAAQPGEKLLLYCGFEPLIVNKEAAEVELWDGKDTRIAFSKLLKALSELQASQIILVMDFLQRDTGIANGRLGDDAIPLMKATIDAAKMPKLAVIFPCEPSQRNWESLPETRASLANEANADSATTQATESLSSSRGTVLTASLFEAFEKGRYTSLAELFDFVRDGVSDKVQTQYGQIQTVQLYPEKSPLRNRELLVRASDLPTLKTEVDVPATESATESAVTNTDAKPLEADNAFSSVVTPQTRLAALIKTRMDLAKSGEALATNPVEWTELALAISSARLDLIHGHEDSAYFDQANQLIDKITFDLSQVKAAKSKISFAPWHTLSRPDELSLPADRLKLFAQAFQNLKQDQPAEDLSFEFQSSETRLQFADWIVREIGTLSETLDIQTDSIKRSKKLTEWRQFIGHLADHGWAQSDWPESLFTIEEILSRPIGEQQVASILALQDLLRLRQRTLECATGTLDGKSRFRQSVWLGLSKDLTSLLIELTAAERWLALGPDGLAKGQQKLKVSQNNWSDVHRKLKAQHEISVLPDLQRTEIPFLIQFLAQQQEEVDITKEELNVAFAVADNILSGLPIRPDQFSPGTHARTGLSTSQIQAMFQLTRNLANSPADTEDLSHLKTLKDYVSTRMATGPDGIEAHRLLTLATPELPIADSISLLRQSSSSETLSNRRHTGLRLSSWSIRLLDSISGTTHTNLWSLWKNLVVAVQGNEADTIRNARAKLAVDIADAWMNFRSQPGNTSAADLFVTQRMASQLLADDLAQRIHAKTPNAKVYRRIYDDRFSSIAALSEKNEPRDWAQAETQVGTNNLAVVNLKADAARVYVQDRAFEPKGKSSQQLGWYRLDDLGPVSALELSAPNSTDETRVLKLLLANKHDVIFASQDLTIYPNAAAQWKVSLVEAGRPIYLTDGRDLRLPPTTSSPKGKNTPIPLNFLLTKVNGAARQVSVALFAIRIDGTEQSMGTRQVSFDSSDTAMIPFAPEVVDSDDGEPKPNSQTTDNVAGIDVRGGIRLEVTSDIRGATATSIMIRPLIAAPTEYVEIPQVEYDSEKQKLTIVVNRKQNVASLSPKAVPLEIHFNPLLSEMLKPDLLGPTKKPDLQDEPNRFEFAFSDELQSRLGGIDNLEFAMSVAGIPHAWRWRLGEDGVTLISPDDPVVRIDLSLQNPNEVRPFHQSGNLLLGADWKQAKLDIRMHLHGGQFGTRKFQAEHELRLNLERQGSNQSLGTIFGAIDVFTFRPESIRVSAGKNGAWNFSTQTTSYEKRGLQIHQENSLGAGRYELVAELKTLATNRIEQYRQAFTFDDTPPNFDSNDIEISSKLQFASPIKGRVTVTDPESDITEIRVGFDESSLRQINASGQFQLPANGPGLPKLDPTAPFQSETATLIVKAMNQAGLETTVQKDLSFQRGSMSSPASKKGATGSVEFKYDSTRAWTATLKNSGGDRLSPKTGRSPILFDDVPVGTYTIFWKTGVGAKSGTTSAFTVKTGETAEVSGP
ncbi:MAG: hypothetical protein ABJZ55_05990 [Fuerstiella sp.]